ncbi:MAG TPA: hypothetical protein PLJ35_22535 [Anaerolineae bacterium]|nr:hypothetical protein [Anaerolineae bacterium]
MWKAQGRTIRWCWGLACLLIGLCLLYYLGVYAIRANALLRFPFDYDQGEGYDVNSAWLLSRGESIYGSPDRYPFYSSNYPPVYALLLAPLVAAFGPQLALGRALSLAATALAVVTIAAAVHTETGRWRPAVGAGLFFLASPYVYHVTPLARINALMVALALLGVFAVSQGARAKGASALAWLAAGGALLLGAAYTRQTALDAVGAALLYLMLRNWRRGLALGLTVLGLGAALYLWLDAATEGGFSLNVFWANANPFSREQALAYWRNFLAVHPLLVLAGAVVLVGGLAHRGLKGLSAYGLYFLASLGVAVGVGKWGAGESYFLGAIAAGCVLLGQAWGWLEATVGRLLAAAPPFGGRRWRAMLAAGGLVVVAGALFVVQLRCAWHGPLEQPDWGLYDRGLQADVLSRLPTEEDLLAGEQIVEHIRQVRGDVLAEECGFVLAAGRPVLGNATQQLNLYEAGLHDPAALVAALHAGRISLVVLNAERYPAPVLRAIGQNYHTITLYEMNGFHYRVLQCNECRA